MNRDKLAPSEAEWTREKIVIYSVVSILCPELNILADYLRMVLNVYCMNYGLSEEGIAFYF